MAGFKPNPLGNYSISTNTPYLEGKEAKGMEMRVKKRRAGYRIGEEI